MLGERPQKLASLVLVRVRSLRACGTLLAAFAFALGVASLVAVGLVGVIAPERPAHAQPAARPHAKSLAESLPSDARRDYDAGKLLFEDGDYATALLMYRTAYDRTHDPRLLWNVAACQKNLRHYAKAATTLERYLNEGGDLLSAADRRDAQDLSKAIAPFTVPMTLSVSEDGAQIWIDDEPIGTSPLSRAVTLDMGTRRLRAKKDGFRTFEREIPVGGSATTTVNVVLERQSGRLEMNIPATATVFIDDQEVGHGPRVALDLAAGAHALRVTAPGRRPLQTDVVVEDAKSRMLDLPLESEGAPTAEVRVAVACIGSDPLPQEGLAVFFDDSIESAIPLGVRVRREGGSAVVAYVSYRVSPGRHLVYVSAPPCEGRDAVVDVKEGGVAEVKGALPPRNEWLEGSPAGSPDGWRLMLGFVESSTNFTSYEQFFSPKPSAFGNVGVTFFGPTATAGLQGRWLTALLDARLQIAHVSPSTAPGPGALAGYGSMLSQWSVGARPGLRLPLVVAALSTGVGLHLGQFYFTPDLQGTPRSGLFASLSYWAAADAQPFCDWGLQVGWSTSADTYAVSSVGNGSVTSFWLHATYTPNTMCNRKRDGLLKIETTTR
jgi:hypothetical protein